MGNVIRHIFVDDQLPCRYNRGDINILAFVGAFGNKASARIPGQSSKLFVNIHPLALEELLPSFEDYLSKYPNIELVVEITERKLIQDFKKFKRLFNNMRERGIKIALDDVGSGYSSLQYLVELEIDYMKIDRSLITALHKNFIKESVVNALAEIAKDLGAKVIAEGIEMTTDLDAIKKLDIQLGQGFLFAHPTIHPTKKIEFHG